MKITADFSPKEQFQGQFCLLACDDSECVLRESSWPQISVCFIIQNETETDALISISADGELILNSSAV